LSGSGERFHDGFVPTYRPSPVYLGPPPPAAAPDPSPFEVNRNLDGYVNTADDSEALKIAYDTGPGILSSVTTHRDWKQNLAQDFDFTALPPASMYDLTGYSQPRIEQWGEELHFRSPDSQDKFRWLAGFYFLDNDLKSFSGFTPGGAPTSTDSDGQTYAVFGQATQTVFDKLDLTVGLRATFDQRHMQGSVLNFMGAALPINAGDQFTALQPKAAIAWHFTPEAEVYASVAEGYQSGGFNAFLNNSEYGAARPLEYELGAKTSWMDNKLTANAALFYTDTSGYQVVRVNPADPVLASLLNAHRAVTYGAELELAAQPTDDLDLNAGLGYTRAQYENFLDPTSGKQLAGQPISFVPEFTANLSATYHFPWHIYVRGEVIGIGRYHMDDSETATSGPTIQDAYELVNLQAGYKVKNFDFYLYARNVFDRRYFDNAINFGVGPALPYSSLILQPGDPETCGVALTASF
jgi:iron complex outermembrane receptor protein